MTIDMTPEQVRSAELLLRSRPYWSKSRQQRMMKDTGGRRFRYIPYTAKHGWWPGTYSLWRLEMTEWVTN